MGQGGGGGTPTRSGAAAILPRARAPPPRRLVRGDQVRRGDAALAAAPSPPPWRVRSRHRDPLATAAAVRGGGRGGTLLRGSEPRGRRAAHGQPCAWRRAVPSPAVVGSAHPHGGRGPPQPAGEGVGELGARSCAAVTPRPLAARSPPRPRGGGALGGGWRVEGQQQLRVCSPPSQPRPPLLSLRTRSSLPSPRCCYPPCSTGRVPVVVHPSTPLPPRVLPPNPPFLVAPPPPPPDLARVFRRPVPLQAPHPGLPPPTSRHAALPAVRRGGGRRAVIGHVGGAGWDAGGRPF
ncbi:hypothetical protein I4F81_006669 [Pyropia yezoensis]|uniref:Uncharacterized protein n=1 Tax=Pyropia yezoensis TaxID=2788 RepID=A0ACC3C1V8_PYRYE|nr:hypothetical protein I4F81_006669 [Neopyropia yezoensis]